MQGNAVRSFATWFSMLALALTVALDIGCTGRRRGGQGQQGDAAKLAGVDDVDDSLSKHVEGDRSRVIYNDSDPYKGAALPTVTIVEFSDFQCRFCKQLAETFDEVVEDYPNDVRVVFKQFPLPAHEQAEPGARAALAAHEQGKFWDMHDELFSNPSEISPDAIEGYARAIELDVAAFRKTMESDGIKGRVAADAQLGRSVKVTSTPTWFINGRLQRGAMPLDDVKALVEEEKAQAKKLLDAGSKPEEIYARIMRAAKADGAPGDSKQQARPGQPDPAANYAVPVGDGRPQQGPDGALVTIIEFSDFQCPYCGRVNPTLSQIKQEYPEDVRVVFRQLPLPFHKQAKPAARAALAAHRQNKFWEMHDLLFENQQDLSEGNFEKWAEQLGLDGAEFKRDYADSRLAKMVDEDAEAARQFGANGTPAFFVNGRFVSGAQPFPAFKALIDEERDKAKQFLAKAKVDRAELYEQMAKGWEAEIKQPPLADHKRRDVSTDGLPAKGNTKRPKITIVECSDFDCPYCNKATTTVQRIVDEYGDKVAVYFRHYPLPMHKNAEPAHRAAIAAGAQGKFWEMHDLLFANQKSRSDDDLSGFAQKLGLDMARWKQAFADAGTAKRVRDDVEVCGSLDVRGAPGFLINGRLLSGARPYEQFKQVLDEELAGGFEAKGGDAPRRAKRGTNEEDANKDG